jgi:hypothetical protein
MAKQLVEIIYKHTHKCDFNEEVTSITPVIRGNAMFYDVPRCPESGVELEEIDRRYIDVKD